MVRSPTRMLSLALAATLIASTGAMFATAWAVSESLEGTGELARREERTAYLVSGIGVDVTRTRARLHEALTESEPRASERLEQARRSAAKTDHAAAELPPLLGPEERAVWVEIQPLVLRMSLRMDRVIAAIEAGDRARAQALLNESVDGAVQLSDELERFREISLEETAGTVEGIQTDAMGTVRIATLAWLGITAALAFVWVLVLRVVSAQREVLATKMTALENANRELDAFAGRVAHDMRNVLSPIQLGVDAMTTMSSEAKVARIADRIRRSCARGRNLVDGLLAFSTAGGAASTGQRADLDKEVSDVLDELRDSIKQARAQVTTRLPPGSAVALAPPLLHVILVNLVGNAVKFLHGRPERHLSIRVRRVHDMLRIEVTDTGPGIPEAELPRVFDALYRGARPRGAGVGLGLATVKRIVESARGRVEIRSVVDVGTTVTVVLPNAEAGADRSSAA